MSAYESASALLLMVAVLSARIGTALMMFPMFAGDTLPAGVRASVIAGLSICLLPMVGAPHMMELARTDAQTLALLLAKEVALGFGLGFVGSAGFWALYAAGSVIENQAGLSMATTIDPLAGREDSLIGGFLVQVLSVVFVASGGLLVLLGVLYESFRVWPVLDATPRIEPSLWLGAARQVIGAVMELALRVAAPFVLLMLMVEMGLGLLGRYAPQLNVFFLALPLKALVLLLLLMFYSLVLVDGAVLPEVAQAMRRLFTGR
jgi:type III secretion protein T